MQTLADIYAAQPFWIWLAVAVTLLAVEAAFTTEWLLWPAAAAGVVALITALGLDFGPAFEVAVFSIVTVVLTLFARRFVQKVNPAAEPDINARDVRFVGQQARVVEPFVNGQGRVFISGAEWQAEIAAGEPPVGAFVTVTAAEGSVLKVVAG